MKRFRLAILLLCVVACAALSGCNLSDIATNCTPGSTIQQCIDQFDSFSTETNSRAYGDTLRR
jgi:hypothetical protein